MTKIDLSGVDLSYIGSVILIISDDDLSGIDLSNFNSVMSVIPDPDIFYILSKGRIKINLTNARLAGVNLTEGCMWGDDLSHADLTAADLSAVNMTRAILRGARTIAEVKLSGACLRDAVLDEADLICAMEDGLINLYGVSMREGKLRRRPA